MGTIFKILSVEQFTGEIWYVTLEMVSEEHEPLKNLFDDYKASLDEESSLLLLGELLSEGYDD
ncbi:unnamed protein product, partial [Rotaria sp. Silwood2]